MTDDDNDKKSPSGNYKGSAPKIKPPKEGGLNHRIYFKDGPEPKWVSEPLHSEPSSDTATRIAEIEESDERTEELNAQVMDRTPLGEDPVNLSGYGKSDGQMSLAGFAKSSEQMSIFDYIKADEQTNLAELVNANNQSSLAEYAKANDLVIKRVVPKRNHEEEILNARRRACAPSPSRNLPKYEATEVPEKSATKQNIVDEKMNDKNIATIHESTDKKKPGHRFISDEDVLEYAKNYKIKCNSGKQETLKILPIADSRYSDYFMLKALEESKLIHLTMVSITSGVHTGKVEVTELRLTIAGSEKLETHLARTPVRRFKNFILDNVWKILIGVVVASIILIIKSNIIDNNIDSSISAPSVQQSESTSSESPEVVQETPPSTQ